MINTALLCKSEYVRMRDGVCLAVSPWLIEGDSQHSSKYPAVLITTRYWRAMALQKENDNPALQWPSLLASVLLRHGFRLVVADARGSGASFGFREAEIGHAEVEDIGELIDWVAQQAWCDGRVATTGCSYTANTTLYSLAIAPAALKIGVCRAPDFDEYRHGLAPGGIVNRWFIEAWGAATAAQDANDVTALYAGGYWPTPENGADNVLGVRPVDEDVDGSLLSAAVADHKANFNFTDSNNTFTFIENHLSEKHRPIFDPAYQTAVEKSNIPLIIHCGWHDAGTQLGALAIFASFSNPIHVFLGPWSHEGFCIVDPLQVDDGTTPDTVSREEVRTLTAKLLEDFFAQDSSEHDVAVIDKPDKVPLRLVEYYTLGENRWKSTQQWPLPQTQIQRLYLATDHKLMVGAPDSQDGSNQYRVDLTATTGLNNRWHAQSPDQPIFFPDRQEADRKLLVYDTPPLENDIEITGHPVVYLYIRSTATDGQFFVYLETIDSEGRIRMLTEGQLRGLHHKVSEEKPPYKMFGPYHSLKEKDAQYLIPGEVTEIAFDLFPISVLLKKGWRVRLAIAGADKDTFPPLEECESPEITVECNSLYASYIDLPIV